VNDRQNNEDKVVELYPIENEDSSIDDVEWSHYVAKLKEHEARRASTNERNEYWRKYNENKRTM